MRIWLATAVVKRLHDKSGTYTLKAVDGLLTAAVSSVFKVS